MTKADEKYTQQLINDYLDLLNAISLQERYTYSISRDDMTYLKVKQCLLEEELAYRTDINFSEIKKSILNQECKELSENNMNNGVI